MPFQQHWWNFHKREIPRTSPAIKRDHHSNRLATPLSYVSLVVWKIICRDYPKCARKDHRWKTNYCLEHFTGVGGCHTQWSFCCSLQFFVNIPNWFFDSQGIIHLKNKKHVPNPRIFWVSCKFLLLSHDFCQLAFINGWQGCWSFEQDMQKNTVGGISIWYVRSEGFDFWPKVYIKSLCNFPPPWLPFRRLSRFFGVMMNFIKIHQRSFNYPYWG